MTYFRKRRFPFRKRTVKKRSAYRRTRPVALPNRPSRKIPLVFPNYRFLKMSYADTITHTSTTGAAAAYQFRMSSLQDCDFTGTGHQPYGHDEISAQYTKYLVYGCKVVLRYVTDAAAKVVLRASHDASTPSDIQLAEERPYSFSSICGSGGNAKTLSRYYNLQQLFGVSKQKFFMDDTFSADFGANPVDVGYLNIILQHMDQSNTVNMYFNIHLTFYCKVFERKLLAQS